MTIRTLAGFCAVLSLTVGAGCGDTNSAGSFEVPDTFTVSLPDGFDAGVDDAGTEDTAAPDDIDETDTFVPDEDTLEDVAEPDTTVADTADTDEPDTFTPDIVDEDVVPPPTITPNNGNCSPAGGNLNVYDLQNPDCPDHPNPEPTASPGMPVELDNVIVTAIYGDTFFVQEQTSGPYSGIAVFAHGEPLQDLEIGMRIEVTGSYSEYFGNSQLYLDQWTVKGTGNVPLPYQAEHPSHLATDGPAAEWFEGVLVRVVDVETTHTQPDCPNHYGEFEVTGDLRIDDMGFLWEARLGDEFSSITGPLHYTFGNHKIEPRDEADIGWVTKGGESAVSKCVTTECEVSEDEVGSQLLLITEIMVDPFGEDSVAEWIELYNPGNNNIDIDGWSLRDCNDQDWTISGSTTTVPPKGFLLLGPNGQTSTNGGVDLDVVYGDAFYLPNTIGSVLLFDAPGFQGSLVDQVRYSAFDPWDVLDSGRSLERISPNANGTVPESWAKGKGTYGSTENEGSPGQANSDW